MQRKQQGKKSIERAAWAVLLLAYCYRNRKYDPKKGLPKKLQDLAMEIYDEMTEARDASRIAQFTLELAKIYGPLKRSNYPDHREQVEKLMRRLHIGGQVDGLLLTEQRVKELRRKPASGALPVAAVLVGKMIGRGKTWVLTQVRNYQKHDGVAPVVLDVPVRYAELFKFAKRVVTRHEKELRHRDLKVPRLVLRQRPTLHSGKVRLGAAGHQEEQPALPGQSELPS